MCMSYVTAKRQEGVGPLRGVDREWLAAKLRRVVAWSVWPDELAATERAISYDAPS